MTRRRKNIVVAAAVAALVLVGRRRLAIAAAVVAAVAVLAVVGFGGRRGDQGRDDPRWKKQCEEDIAGVFAGCRLIFWPDCALVSQEFAYACTNECMTRRCPDEVGYLEWDPIWELPCDDMHGARFWRNLSEAADTCAERIRYDNTINWNDWRVHHACQRAEAEKKCVALAGTDWWEKYRVAKPWTPNW
jgi:hypothetical protein